MGYPYSTTYRAGSLSEAQYNADQQNHATQNTPTSINDFSNDVTEMQTTVNPGGVGSEVLATDLSGELARIRYLIKAITGQAQWYVDPGTTLAAAQFASNTRLAFNQASAPSGWVKETGAAYNDAMLRIVTGPGAGTGGANAFSTVMAQSSVGSHVLTTAEMPIHTITTPVGNVQGANSASGAALAFVGNNSTTQMAANSIGSGSGHVHSLTMNVKYTDFIICTKS